VIEYVDNLHEHFENPVTMSDCRYLPPQAPGYSTTMRTDSLDHFEFPSGRAWSGR
jgi:L-fuconate dehydratase